MFGSQRPAFVRIGATAERLTFYPASGGANEQNLGVVLMALGNDALPDDSPYKITRDDVELLRDAVTDLANYDRVRRRLEPLAGKLAALLPPK